MTQPEIDLNTFHLRHIYLQNDIFLQAPLLENFQLEFLHYFLLDIL